MQMNWLGMKIGALPEPNIFWFIYERVAAREIDLSGDEDEEPYIVQWFDPRNGGPLRFGSHVVLQATKAQHLGEAPSDRDLDWVVLLTKCHSCPKSNETEDKVRTGLIVALSIMSSSCNHRSGCCAQLPESQSEAATGAVQ